jgi:hypothetical protein
MDPKRELLRHAVAIVAYRAGKALRGAPPAFPTFTRGESSRTPGQILGHMGDLFDWALALMKGAETWDDRTPLVWDLEIARFFNALAALDAYLASDAPLAAPVERILQGPIADALTHVGQINLLRRLAGSPVRGENYFRADITVGAVGLEQPPPRREF